MDCIQKAIDARCALFLSLTNSLLENGYTTDDLMPHPSLYQSLNLVANEKDGCHLKLHLSHGEKRLCNGVGYRVLTHERWDRRIDGKS